MKTFNDAFSLGTEFDFTSLEYENTCDSSAVTSIIGPMMGDLTAVGFIAGPYGALLRFAEGIDSIRNLAKTGDMTLTESQRGAAIVCSIAQLGGVIWMAVATVFLAMACVCAPCGSWACLRCYRICRGASRRSRQREEALDELLQSQEIGSAYGGKRQKRRSTGHVLVWDGDTQA